MLRIKLRFFLLSRVGCRKCDGDVGVLGGGGQDAWLGLHNEKDALSTNIIFELSQDTRRCSTLAMTNGTRRAQTEWPTSHTTVD